MSDLTDIADVATDSILIEHCGPSRKPAWAPHPGTLADGVHNPFLAWETMAGIEIRQWHLRDVVFDASTFLLFHRGKVIRQSNYHRSPRELEEAHIDADRLTPIPTELPVLICGDDWSTNHYHFLNHTLPAIHAVSARCPALRLIGHAMRPVHAEAAHRLGHGHHPRLIVERGRQYAIAEAMFCDYTMGRADFADSAIIQAMHDALAQQVADDGRHDGRLYVSRTGDTHRHMRGEADLIDGLRLRGFQIVEPATLPLAEQIATFRAARIVVGPHGAGMANVAFCRPGTVVYDLLPAHFIEPSILTLCIRRHARAWVDAFPTDHATVDHTLDWRVDVDQALRRVDTLLGWPRLRRLGRSLVRPRRMI